MGALRELTPQTLRRFVSVDNEREVALVAVTEENGRMRQLGECRYAACADGDSCEFAVAVLDAWQRRGLGRRLMSELIHIASIRGFAAIIGEVLTNNSSMLALASKLGFEVSPSSDEYSVNHVSLALPRRPAYRANIS
jgi:acetyltransferase